MIPIYKPYLPKSSLAYAHEAIDSGWISSQGKYVSMVAEKLQELLNVKYVLPVNNGTSACHLMAKCLSKKLNTIGKKYILVPDNVYVAAWNSLMFDQEYILVPIKADLKTWNMDMGDLDRAIKQYPGASCLIVSNLGNITNVPELQKKYPDTIFIEDNCEGLFGKYNGAYSGTAALCSSISFFGNKTITGGESGALVLNDEELYIYAKCIHSQGQSNKRFVHTELGNNFRITNIASALIIGQLSVLTDILDMKNNIFDVYRKAFSGREDVCVQEVCDGTTPANWMMGIKVPNSTYRDAEKFLASKGIEARPMFFSIQKHSHLQNHSDVLDSDCGNADSLNKECIILPSFPELSTPEQKFIIDSVNEYIESCTRIRSIRNEY